jgi:hypothetical protein
MREHGENVDVNVGKGQIAQSVTAKLLGMEIDDNQKWKPHVEKLVKTLVKRLFSLRRIAAKTKY